MFYFLKNPELKLISIVVNLKKISRFMPNARFEKQKFAAITIRLAFGEMCMIWFVAIKRKKQIYCRASLY